LSKKIGGKKCLKLGGVGEKRVVGENKNETRGGIDSNDEKEGKFRKGLPRSNLKGRMLNRGDLNKRQTYEGLQNWKPGGEGHIGSNKGKWEHKKRK